MQIYIFDNKDNLLEILDDTVIISYNHVLKGNGASEFNLSINKKNNNLKKYNKVGFFNDDEEFQLFLINTPDEYNSIEETSLTINCLDDIVTLANNIVEDKRVAGGSALNALEKIVENTGYKVGNVENFENNNINFYFISSLTGLNNIIDTYGCEFKTRIVINDLGRIEAKYIDLVHRLGKDTGLRFTYDTNVNSIERTTSDDGHFNVLYGRGSSLETEDGSYSRKLTFADVTWSTPSNPINKPLGQIYIEDAESIAKYGRLEGIYENDNIGDAQVLLQKTYDKLQEVKDLKYSYVVDADDLRNIEGFEHYKYTFGDSIVVLDEDENITVEARILEINKVVNLEENTKETKITLGNFRTGLIESEDDIKDVIDSIKDQLGNIGDSEITDSDFPDILPDAPILSGKGLFATIMLNWTYENKLYYTYEVFASKIKDFAPGPTNRIYEGKASAFLHEVNPEETWYYRARAKNTHGHCTDYSNQLTINTYKISNSENYFEEAAIKDATIGELNLDRGWVGKLVGNHIDAKNLSVTDGNGNKTLDIDSFGRVSLDVTNFNIKSENINNLVAKNLIDGGNFRERNFSAWNNKHLYNIEFYEGADGATGIKAFDISKEGWIVSNLINLKSIESNIFSLACKMFVEPNVRSTEIYLQYYNLDKNLLQEIWLCELEAGFNGIKKIENIKANNVEASYIAFRIDNNGAIDVSTSNYTVLYIDYINVTIGATAVEGFIKDDGKVQTIAEQTVNSFRQEVSKDYAKNSTLESDYTKKTTFEQTVEAFNLTNQKTSESLKNLTSFQQTSENFTFKIKNQGVNNLVKNSSFENHRGVITYLSSGVENILITKKFNELVLNDNFLYIQGNGDVYAETSLNFIAEPNQTYTFSIDCRYASIGRINGSSSYIKINNNYYHIFFEDNFGYGWHRTSTTWTCPSNISGTAYIRLGFKCDAYTWGCYNNLKVEKGSIATAWCAAENEINEGVTFIDENGITVSHTNGSSSSFYHNGSVWRNIIGEEILRINGQGLEFVESNTKEWVGFIKTAIKQGQNQINGISISNSGLGDFLALGCSTQTDPSSSWSSSEALTLYNTSANGVLSGLHFWSAKTNSSDKTYVHNHTSYIQETGNMYLNNQLVVFDSFGHDYPNFIGRSSTGKLLVFGNDAVTLGTRHGTTNVSAITITEGSSDDEIHFYGSLNMHGRKITNTSLQYSYANLYARKYTETTVLKTNEDSIRYIFKDMQIKDKKLIVSVPKTYQGCEYSVTSIVKKGRGDVWVAEEYENYFIVESENDIKVNIEIDILLETNSNFKTINLYEKEDNSIADLDIKSCAMSK